LATKVATDAVQNAAFQPASAMMANPRPSIRREFVWGVVFRRLAIPWAAPCVLLFGCSDAKPEAKLAKVSSAVTLAGGMRILSDTDTSLAFNAYGGATDGAEVRLWSNCPKTNPACMWMYRQGMIVSKEDPNLAVKGGPDLTVLKLKKLCTVAPTDLGCCSPGNVDCNWTWKKGMLHSGRGSSYMINAWLGRDRCPCGDHWLFESIQLGLPHVVELHELDRRLYERGVLVRPANERSQVHGSVARADEQRGFDEDELPFDAGVAPVSAVGEVSRGSRAPRIGACS
jgi:hypothetical protein